MRAYGIPLASIVILAEMKDLYKNELKVGDDEHQRNRWQVMKKTKRLNYNIPLYSYELKGIKCLSVKVSSEYKQRLTACLGLSAASEKLKPYSFSKASVKLLGRS